MTLSSLQHRPPRSIDCSPLPSRCRSRRRKARCRFYQPLVEQFEDRSLLSAIITVNSNADSDDRDSMLTLREAIEISNRTLAVPKLSATEQTLVNGTPTSTDTDTIAFNILGTGEGSSGLSRGKTPILASPLRAPQTIGESLWKRLRFCVTMSWPLRL
ncbi:MAG TPA: hypothetical protein VKH44_11760 [Pirellulaceae bacterium]|nr:hypothetical protein [Pirellulaceae bacterium]